MANVTSAEQLLQDIAWLRRLATRLAGDRDDAEDLVQEAWIAAWQRQPDRARPMRGWLTKVVRDLAGMRRRSDRRRAARDAATEEAPAPAATDELLAQLRLQQRLVDLVLALDEPYRSTVLARFVEGRTSAEIARSLGIPEGTVRKRLHEALARLRAGLDAHAGARSQWAPAVLAFGKVGVLVAKPAKLVTVVIVALLLASVATVLVVLPRRDEAAEPSSAVRLPPPNASKTPPPVTADARPGPDPAAASLHRAADRPAMLAAITRAREARERGGATAPVPTPPGERPSLDSPGTTLALTDKSGDTSDWGKRALGTLNTLLGQCYDLAVAETPGLDGAITVRFTLVGEPGVGGLLERVEIVDGPTTITQPTMRSCLTEQLYALELDPPPAGVTVEREISLRFP